MSDEQCPTEEFHQLTTTLFDSVFHAYYKPYHSEVLAALPDHCYSSDVLEQHDSKHYTDVAHTYVQTFYRPMYYIRMFDGIL